MARTAKIFMNGRSQAVRLPAEFRFDTQEVFISRDEKTGDVILLMQDTRKANWDRFPELRAAVMAEMEDDSLSLQERAQGDLPRDPFEGWEE
jgi:antitoxin VapB